MREIDDFAEDEDPAAVEDAWADEIERRMQEADRGEVEMIPAEEMMARYWARRRSAGPAGQA
jgi:putative addiction module component (TIGR02574 family)